MNSVVELIFKNFWILFIPVSIINVLMMKSKTKKYIIEKPELKEGYDNYFKAFLFYGNIPWAIMAIGMLSGKTQSIFDFISPTGMNPIVIIFHGSIIVLWILLGRWVYFKNGAEFMENHPGLIQASGFNGKIDVTAKHVKRFFPLMILGGVIAMIVMWNVDFPIPNFK